MARVVTAPEKVHFRSNRQSTRLYLGVLQPATVFTARVNGAPSSDDEVYELTFDTGSGAGGLADQIVYVGTTAGAYDKGMVRLRSDVSGASGTMEIGEISEIEWANNDYLTVKDEIALAARHLYINPSEVVFMDRDIAYSDQHEYPNPIPVFGPSLIPTWLTGADVQVDFDASGSWALDGGAVTYAWAFPGSFSNGGLTGATTWAKYNAAGTYRVELAVTRDYGGGNIKTTTAYRYVLVYTSAAPPMLDFHLEQCGGSWSQRGYTFRVSLDEATEADILAIRDRAWVVLFTRDFYGDTEINIGPIDDRENILCQGWIAAETITVDKEQGRVSFEIRHPIWWLNQMRGFPTGIEDVQTTPAAWTEYEGLTFRAGFWAFVFWRSTLPILLDLTVTSDTREIALFNASPGTLGAQIIGEANNTIRAYPCCDYFGRLFCEIEPQLIPETSRGSITVVQDIELQDLRRPFTLTRRVVKPIGQVDLTGVLYSGGANSPLFSLSPGHIFGWHGSGIDRADRLALSSQAQANELAGLLLGWKNLQYPQIQLPLAANYRMVDITPHQYLTLAIGTGDNIRGLDLSFTLVVRSVAFKYDEGTGQMLTDLVCEETSIAEASQDGDIPPDPPDPPDPIIPDPTPWEPLPDLPIPWPAECYVGTDANGVYYSANCGGVSDPQWSWTHIDTGLTDRSTTYWLQVDKFNPSYRQYVLISDSTAERHIYRREGGGAWASILTETQADALTGIAGRIKSIYSDPEEDGVLWAVWDSDAITGGDVFLLKSSTYGTSWSAISVWSSGNIYSSWMVRRSGQTLIVTGTRNVAARYWISTNLGGSWVECTSSIGASLWLAQCFANSLNANPYVNGNGSNGPDLVLTNGVAWSVVRDADNIGPLDPAAMWLSRELANYHRILKNNRIYSTLDAWSTMSTGAILTIANLSSINAPVLADESYLFFGRETVTAGTPHHIYISGDEGSTLVGRAGTNAGTSPYTNAIPWNSGGICSEGIQPVADY